MTYYYIYKITNKINKKIYYGQHTTSDLDDGYMGSGTALHKAFEKYGVENFEKKILKFYNSPEELNIVESRLVNERWLKKNKNRTYNLQTGGKQRDFLSQESKQKISESLKGRTPWNKGKNNYLSDESRAKISDAVRNRTPETRKKISDGNKGKTISSETRKKISESLKGENSTWYGKHLNDDAKKKISESIKGRHWYNNGIIEFQARECPDGFIRGRLKKNKIYII